MNTLSSTTVPLSIYVHTPWCVEKCPYCDFNSHKTPAGGFDDIQYVDALLKDLEISLPLVWGRPVLSVFIGGGTPSLFSPEAIDRLLSGIRKLLPVTIATEVTMEANPGTVEQGKFNEFAATGINRLSIGIQSFNDAHLAALGRIHSAAESLMAVATAKAAGFDNINLDLMYGLPRQSLEDGKADILQALALNTNHLSFYQLTIEPNTLFHKQKPVLPESEDLWRMQQLIEHLTEDNYEHYEVSAYCRPGKQARHNINYWEFGDYLGIGAGAHGKITDMAQNRIIRTLKPRHPDQYLHSITNEAPVKTTTVSVVDLPFEYMLNRLRLNSGFTRSDYESRTLLTWETVSTIVDQCVNDELMTYQIPFYKTSSRGQLFLNDLVERFLV